MRVLIVPARKSKRDKQMWPELYILFLFTVPGGKPHDCYHIISQKGKADDGTVEYDVYFSGENKKRVWCDMKTKGGGWTVCKLISKHVLL